MTVRTAAQLALDAGQEAVVGHGSGRVKVRGPMASGKTTTLVERAARLVDDGAEPEGILFFVQDRGQAIALRDRFVRRLGRSVAGPSIFTFHAFAWSLLTRAFPVDTPDGPEVELGYRLAGLEEEPVLLPAFDQRAFVRQLLTEENPADWPVNSALLASNAFAGEVRDFMLRAQERLLTASDLRRLAHDRDRPDWVELAGFLERYQSALTDPERFADGRPRVDFAGVLVEARWLINEHPQVCGHLRSVYPHLLVDDLEEANRGESYLLDPLLPEVGDAERSAAVAADPHGTVFGFRGADPSSFARIEGHEVELTERYRRAAEPEVRLYAHVTEEARGIVAELRQAWGEGISWGDMAVVVRDFRALITPLRRELARVGVPHHVEGESLQLATDPVIAPIIDLFSVACKRKDHEELWAGLMASEIGGLAAHEMLQVRRAARLQGLGLHEVCSSTSELDLSDALKDKLEVLCAVVGEACRWAEELSPDDCFWELWRSSEWFAHLVDIEDDRRLDSLTSFADAVARFTERRGRSARMADFIDTLLSAEFAPGSVRLRHDEDAVILTTAHNAKGRGFELAVVAGCVEGMWPDPARRGTLLDVELLDGDRVYGERRKAAMDEELRLFKLACSRAPRMILTGQRAGGSDRMRVEPSRFLPTVVSQLPEENSSIPELILTAREAEVAWRRTLSDVQRSSEQRVAALWGLAQLEGVDPNRWWWGQAWTESEAPVIGERKRTSYSRFSSYENCPLNYLMGQVLGLDPYSTYQLAFGRLIHGLLEDIEKGVIPSDLDSALAEARRRWRPEEYPPGAVSDYLQRNLRKVLSDYFEKEATNGHRSLATEYEFSFDVAGWTIRGKIDRIDACGQDGVGLIDYKSGGYKRDPDVQGPPPDLQLATYILACHKVDELRAMGRPKQAQILSLQYSNRQGFIRASLFPKDADDGTPFEKATEERIENVLKGIESEEFAPSPDAQCRYCKFKPLCPMWSEGQELKV
jgi:superfamily I DNA/RNA helicase/RecB family exonuclease